MYAPAGSPVSRHLRHLLVVALLAGALAAHADPAPPLPVVVGPTATEPANEDPDPALQARLESRLLANPVWADLIRRHRMAVGLVDMTHPDSARFARINGRTMMYAASLPKIAILLAAHQAIEDGDLQETPQLDADLADMIRFSNNRAATRVYRLVGFERVRDVLLDPRYKLFDRAEGGGLWVGKAYARDGPRHGDPLKNLSHAATVTEVCRFYYLMATGQLVSVERSRQMLDAMRAPGIYHKFVRSLGQLAPRARLYRKSGTWRTWHADSVLVWGDAWRRYILVALVRSPRGGAILEQLVPAVETVLGH